MSYLIDTHILLWYLNDDPKLGGLHKDIIENESSFIQLYFDEGEEYRMMNAKMRNDKY